MFLLDTNFLIDLHAELRRKDAAEGPAKRFMRANKTLPMAITPVTANEYAAGIRNEREARRFLRRFRMIASDATSLCLPQGWTANKTRRAFALAKMIPGKLRSHYALAL
jgi:predicted nucleic acid-binding protein